MTTLPIHHLFLSFLNTMAAQADFQEFTSRPNLFLPLVFDHSVGQRARSNRHRCPAGGTRGSHRVNLAGAAKDSLWRDKEGYILIKIKEDLEM
jgi:hypothetical protein